MRDRSRLVEQHQTAKTLRHAPPQSCAQDLRSATVGADPILGDLAPVCLHGMGFLVPRGCDIHIGVQREWPAFPHSLIGICSENGRYHGWPVGTHVPENQGPRRDPEAGLMVRVRIVRVVNDQNLWILLDEYPQDLVGSRGRGQLSRIEETTTARLPGVSQPMPCDDSRNYTLFRASIRCLSAA